MAPRSAKAKKTANIKSADSEAPKAGRGKGKKVEEVDNEPEEHDQEVPVVIEKKTSKRGRKANPVNGDNQINDSEDVTVAAKKGRKKNTPTPVAVDSDNDDDGSIEDKELNGDNDDSNGNSEDKQSAPTGRGRKKQAKKETAVKVEPKPGRGRKAKQDNADSEASEDAGEKKVKPAPKGRGRKAQPKVSNESDDKTEDEVKSEPPAPKGRKKAQPKTVKEKSPISDDDESQDTEETIEEPKKGKGRKTQGKKAQAKEIEDKNEEESSSKGRKGSKKNDIKKDDSKEDEDADIVPEEDEPSDEEMEDAKPTKGKRKQKKAPEATVDNDDEPQDIGEPTSKRRRKADTKEEDVKTKAPSKNKSSTDYNNIDLSNSSRNSQGKEWNFKIASWNVDGIRAWMSKGGLDYIKHEKPDILCLQEIKCSQEKLPNDIANLPGYHAYWLCSEKDGYAGVGIYTTKLAMNVQYGLQNEELDTDGRIITAEYEQFYLICTYVPNAGRKLVALPKRLRWNDEFRKYVKELDKKKPVIICGDMNVAHNEIDLANPKTNKKNAGFTEEERAGMTDLLGDGFVDTYRHMNPDKTGAYTFWTYLKSSREKNVGWRLDYFIVSERLMPAICDNVIRDKVYGSDHCPLSLFLHLTNADKPKE